MELKSRHRFQLFFLKNDEYEDVEVEEAEQIDFEELMARLAQGEAVFITYKCGQVPDLRLRKREAAKEPFYFTHV